MTSLSRKIREIGRRYSTKLRHFMSIKAITQTIAIKWKEKYDAVAVDGHIAQSVTCLATDACLTADPGVTSLIPARSHTFVAIDHEIISTVILLSSSESFKKGCCQ